MTYLYASWNSGSGWVQMLVSARSTVAISSSIKFPVYIEVLRLLNSYPAELLLVPCGTLFTFTSKLFPLPAILRCGTADYDRPHLHWPSPAFSLATCTDPASRLPA